jgi:uncharacterized protein (TIGR02284 family)
VADNDKVIATLNDLIETCKDGQQGYTDAAENVKSGEYKTLFHTYAQQRAQLAAELQAEVQRLGGDPEHSGSTAAALHRRWIDVKSLVTGHDDAAIINECERGEDVAVEAYEKGLKESLPVNIKEIVTRQFGQVKAAHDRIRDLKKMYKG